MNCLIFVKIGATNVLIANPRDIPGLVKELAQTSVHRPYRREHAVQRAAQHPDFARLDFAPLRVTVGGGMAVQQAVRGAMEGGTGKALIEAYGLTEASPAVTAESARPDRLQRLDRAADSLHRDRDPRRREGDLPIGEPGELCVRGPQVMKGYWKQPDETAKVMTPDGFLRTGDVAVMDRGGFVRIVDRKKDMIIVSGFNVYPNEIEDVVAMCPGVLEAGVFGMPDPASGEAVWVAIVKKDPALTAQESIAHCRNYLPAIRFPVTSNSSPRCRNRRSEKCCGAHFARKARRRRFNSSRMPTASYSATAHAQLSREDVASNS